MPGIVPVICQAPSGFGLKNVISCFCLLITCVDITVSGFGLVPGHSGFNSLWNNYVLSLSKTFFWGVGGRGMEGMRMEGVGSGGGGRTKSS